MKKSKQKKIKVDELIKKDLIEKLIKLGMPPRTALRKAIKLILKGAKNGKRN